MIKKTQEYIIGIDADISKIGVAITEYNDKELIESYKLTSKLKGFNRTINLIEQLKSIIEKYHNEKQNSKIKFGVIEDHGFVFMARSQALKGEILGCVKFLLYSNEIPFLKWISRTKKKGKQYESECMVIPTQLIKFIFGTSRISSKGKSSQLMLETWKKTKCEFKTDDECDAFWLTIIGIFYCLSKNNEIQNTIKLKNGKVISLTIKQKEPLEKWIKNPLEYGI